VKLLVYGESVKIMERLKAALVNYWWVRVAVGLGLLIGGIILYTLSGGFPPWAWRFAASIFPQASRLWAAQGAAILFPLIGLGLLSLSLLILWAVLLWSLVKLIVFSWQLYHDRQRFAQDLEEAEYMAEYMARREMEEGEQMRQLSAKWQPESALPARASRREPVRSGASSVPSRSRPSRSPARWSQDLDEAIEFEVSDEAIEASQKMAAMERAAATQRRKVANAPEPSATYSEPTYRSQPAQPAAYKTTGLLSSWEGGNATYEPVARSAQPPAAPPRVDTRSQPLSSPLPAPSTGSLRSQFHIVPRSHEEEEELPRTAYSTQPYLENGDIEEPPTLPTTEKLSEEEDDDLQAALRLVVGIGLDPGIARKDSPNEDNLLAIQGLHDGAVPLGLFVVADGMGGHADGQEASRLAIQSISDVVSPAILRNAEPDETFSDLLKDGAHRANLTIYRRNREQEHMMGTTLTAALVVGTQAYVVNVGDSRTYRYRPCEGLVQISRDHSVVARLVEAGVISREDIYTHPKRNQIYRCLGEKASLELDYFHIDVQAGDILILCSDGLWEMVRDPDIENIVASSSPHASQISSMLIQAALTRGGADNISVVAVCVLPAE
jgi:serine/threonine protein phosphatase PrpC